MRCIMIKKFFTMFFCAALYSVLYGGAGSEGEVALRSRARQFYMSESSQNQRPPTSPSIPMRPCCAERRAIKEKSVARTSSVRS